ncbi:2-amino-4-oxopentanoate thiolase subunit OrtA [Clostridium polynesiense]|uniref:2-amino-4-oxopentanoate thiolase subunit OrtA n=1 Tax=Clostridium polynesiense TaxID=1325933 RepID=UPI00058E9710|nr:2-amino-4-oxopentanoate thiolase subunit OrtA [Clostridium polynesiense]
MTWVEIEKLVLRKEDRADNIPEDTKGTDLKMWCKGFLIEECSLGEVGEICTLTGRRIKGRVCRINPDYSHGFGNFIPEVMYIGIQARKILFNEEDNR